MSALLLALRESREFQVVMEEMLKSRPVVPSYTPQKTRDLTEHLIENIKHASSMRQGFDVLYRNLVGQPPE